MVKNDIYAYKSVLDETPNLYVVHLRYDKLFTGKSDI